MAIYIDFDEVELDRYYSEQASGGPSFQTSIIGNAMGVHQRNVNLYDAIRTYSISFEGISPSKLEELEEFFIQRRGMARGFRFLSPDDNTFDYDLVTDTPNGIATEFFLYRNYSGGGFSTTRQICKLDADKLAEIEVFFDGVSSGLFYPTNYSFDINNGFISFASPPAANTEIRITGGRYFIPVCFNTDKFSAERQLTFANWSGIEVVEILPSNLELTLIP